MNSNNIYKEITRAEQNADIGRILPSFDRLSLLKRVIYRAVIKFLYRFLRVITIRQNEFNDAVIKVLKANAEMYYDSRLRAAGETTRINGVISSYDSKIKDLENKIGDMDSNIKYLKNMVLQLDQERDRHRMIEPEEKQKEKDKGYIKKIDSKLDSLYVFLEDNLRGSREDIKNRLRVYVPYIKKATSRIKDFSGLDIGCGRGEWLEILSENNIKATGIDTNIIMVKNCRDLGLDVKKEDIITYISSIDDGSTGAVTAFHLIEHYEFEDLVFLFRQVFRILKPGGIAIFETPDPANIIVGSDTFYLDPTHKKPIPSLLAELLVQACGFNDTKVIKLHPVKLPEEKGKKGISGIKEFYDYFFGPQDYAVIGYKK